MNRPLVHCVFVGLLPVITLCQTPIAGDTRGGSCGFWGQIVGSTQLLEHGMEMELVARNTGQAESAIRPKLFVPANGNFDFGMLPRGDYQVRIRDTSGNGLLERVLAVGERRTEPVILFVHDLKWGLAKTYTVSLSSLQHKVPKRALEDLQTAKRTYAAGDQQNAIKHLNDALNLDPDFAEAHSDLAVIYARQGRLDQALEHAQAGFRLNPQLSEAGCNLALLLMNMKRHPEAEQTARDLLSEQDQNSIPHGVLAISLIAQRKNLDEALTHLSKAVPAFPFFRLLAANALAETFHGDLAVIQVKEYLRSSAHDCERQSLEAWVAKTERRLSALQ
jgi:tetratricopeptide (TPR) repeat protein